MSGEGLLLAASAKRQAMSSGELGEANAKRRIRPKKKGRGHYDRGLPIPETHLVLTCHPSFAWNLSGLGPGAPAAWKRDSVRIDSVGPVRLLVADDPPVAEPNDRLSAVRPELSHDLY
jgi:hypothetical protein